MFLCCESNSHSDNEDDNTMPIESYDRNKNSFNFNNNKDKKYQTTGYTQMKNHNTTNVTSQVSNNKKNNEQYPSQSTNQSLLISTIQTLKTQNNNKKISISYKRQNYATKYNHLQNRVNHLKYQYSLKQKSMKDIQNRIQKFIEQDLKVSSSTEVADDQHDFLLK